MKKILIIEDEIMLAESLKVALERYGFIAHAVNTGEEAMIKMKEGTYDLILLDLYLPGMNGIEILKMARDMDVQSKVIIMTAYGSLETSIEGMRLGAIDYINKSEGLLRDLRESIGRVFPP